MPTLTWVGKDKVVNHHHEVPFRVLNKQYSFSQEPGARSQEPGARSQEPGARSQEPGARSQEPGARRRRGLN
jgi:hypothetical protein